MRPRLLAAVPALLVLATFSACNDDGDEVATDSSSETASEGSASQHPSVSGSTGDAPAGNGKECTYNPDGSDASVEPPPATAAYAGKVRATMSTSIGDLRLTLDADNAPCTVNSFLSLADQGYFDGTSCHRLTVSQGFEVLQCGDPTGTGSGGPGYSFDDELSGEETYGAGTLAMANAGPNTNGSQFFVVYGDTGLPPSYTVFGSVDQAGLDAIAKAAEAGVEPLNGPEDGKPKTPVEIEGVERG